MYNATTTESTSITMKLTAHLIMEHIHLHGWNWMSAGAAFGLCFGILSPLVGSVITAITWFIGPQWHGFFIQRDGTVLLFLTIPLLIFGGHCLDLLDTKDKAAKRQRSNIDGETRHR
jgi:hypothetical protein